MTARTAIPMVFSALLLTACGTDDAAPASGTVAPGGGAPAPEVTPSIPPSGKDPLLVWRPDSVAFRVDQTVSCPFCRYLSFLSRKPTPAQLAALEAMTLKSSSTTCWQDSPSATVVIYDTDGEERQFWWNDREDSCYEPRLLLTNGSFMGLRATIPVCEVGTEIATNGCLISVPLSVPRGPFHLRVQANETRTIFLTDCDAAQPTLRLTDEAGQTLATGTPGPLACSQIQHQFAAAGTYTVGWELTEGWAKLGAE
ncbi:MAG TPA: hypothetical protein VGF45_14190 [Polyangia bacterium]